MTALQWNNQQSAALEAVQSWLRNTKRQQVFRLFGYAGTGKTTLAKHLAETANGRVLFCAYTGKAAHVLGQKGCDGASTIHSLIYRLKGEDEDGPTFVLNEDSPVKGASLVVVDECSMVGPDLAHDLLSFGASILVLGDPAQLPPVKGAGYFTDAEPDVMLTEITRQARKSPIIEMATRVRCGEPIQYGAYGESAVLTRNQINAQAILAADQILVGRNKTRRSFNGRIRELRGLNSNEPEAGDKLVCLRNNRETGLLNGSIWWVKSLLSPEPPYELAIESDTDGASLAVECHPHGFEGRENDLKPYERMRADLFDFGYALTVHKSQGSQWDSVVLFDESASFGDNARRWLYTGITRAARTIQVVR